MEQYAGNMVKAMNRYQRRADEFGIETGFSDETFSQFSYYDGMVHGMKFALARLHYPTIRNDETGEWELFKGFED